MPRPLLCLALAVAFCGTVASNASAGPAPDGFQYGWGVTGSQCIRQENGLVYAHVTSSMWVHNRGVGGHWVTNFRIKARLIGKGSNLQRSWRKSRFPVHSDLLQDHDYAHGMAVNTDNVNPEAEDWVLEVKQIWDRKVPWHDIVRHFTLKFDSSHCKAGKAAGEKGGGPGTTPGVNLPEVQFPAS